MTASPLRGCWQRVRGSAAHILCCPRHVFYGRWAARVFDLATPYGQLRVRIFGLIEVANTQIRDQSRRWCNGILTIRRLRRLLLSLKRRDLNLYGQRAYFDDGGNAHAISRARSGEATHRTRSARRDVGRATARGTPFRPVCAAPRRAGRRPTSGQEGLGPPVPPRAFRSQRDERVRRRATDPGPPGQVRPYGTRIVLHCADRHFGTAEFLVVPVPDVAGPERFVRPGAS